MMNRRQLIAASLTPASAWLLSPGAAHAHHGWSSFDQDRPLYLEGRAAKVAWRNPHAELELEVATRVQPEPADVTAESPAPAASGEADSKGKGVPASAKKNEIDRQHLRVHVRVRQGSPASLPHFDGRRRSET